MKQLSAEMPGAKVNRYKGLGEMNPDQLWETTMNPDNRVIVQIKIEDAERADEAFSILMIRQGTGYDNGHGIIQKCRFDLLLDIAHNDLRARTGHHDNIFFHSTHLSDCFKALLQKLHRKSSLYHQNIKKQNSSASGGNGNFHHNPGW